MSSSTTPSTPSDLVIFLDLDQTLINSDYLNKTITEGKDGLQSFTSGDYEVYKRPHVDEFLKQLSLRYPSQVYVFTAAVQEYADPILDALDPLNTIFKKRFYREHLTEASCKNILALDYFRRGGDKTKKIDPRRFVLIDDIEWNMMGHPCNGIKIKKFRLTGSNRQKIYPKDDRSLLKVLEVLQLLETVDDVRPVLNRIFGWDFYSLFIAFGCSTNCVTPI